ncbi:unnamed protein product [Acanthosepion pharaonis]|uniref:Uncharacterized protein n=1 Tax=Acanthosepion pharaonis TaxID=158019 RepID=A0A812DY35_ACAPH|nr:unnamed protein product [Sepia pharaonis]
MRWLVSRDLAAFWVWLHVILFADVSVSRQTTGPSEIQTMCRDYNAVSANTADWFKACQALETLGLIALLLAFIILFLYMFVESCRGRNALMAIMMCTFAGVAFVVIGVIIFNTKKGYQMYSIGWSMGLAIAGAIFSFIAGIMVVMGYLGK